MQDDTAADVHADYLSLYNDCTPPTKILPKLRKKHADLFDEPNDVASFWFAVAKAQWTCGTLTADVRTRVETLVRKGFALELWEEAGEIPLAKRKRALAAFVKQLKASNPNPRLPTKPKDRKAIFTPGDCLSILIRPGLYGAAVVLADPPEARAKRAMGLNLIYETPYRGPTPPPPAMFTKRPFRLARVSVFSPHGFRSLKNRFRVVGRIELRKSDPAVREDKRGNHYFVGADYMSSVSSWRALLYP